MLFGVTNVFAEDVTLASGTFDGKAGNYTEGWTTNATGAQRNDCVVVGAGENITSPTLDLSQYSKITISIKARRYGTLSDSKAIIDASIDGTSVGTTEAKGTSATTQLTTIEFTPTESMTAATLVFTCTNATGTGSTHGAGINSIEITGTTASGDNPSEKTSTTVKLSEHVISGIVGGSMDIPTATVYAGETALENATVVWNSTKPEVAAINTETGKIEFLAVGETSITATFEGDDTHKASQSFFPLTITGGTYTSLKALQDDATATKTPVTIEFNNVYVNAVTASNAYLADADGYGILYYQKDHSLKAGRVINGTAQANLILYKGQTEITDLTFTNLTFTDGALEPTEKTIDAITAANQSTLVKLKNVKYTSDGNFTDGKNNIKFYDTFGTEVTLEADKAYDVTGIVILFNTTLEIAPRTATDIVEATTEPDPQPSGEPTVIYSWAGGATKDDVVETGGTAVASDGESVNYANATYWTIRLNGKKDFSTNTVTITLDKSLHYGDMINITGYRNKNAADKQTGALLKFEKGSTNVSTANTGFEFVNIDTSDASAEDPNRGTEPNTITLTVPEDAAGSKTITMTRAEQGTNFFITKLEITSTEEQGGVEPGPGPDPQPSTFRDIKADLTSTALLPEGAEQWNDVSTGIAVAEDGTLSRVATDAENAAAIFNGNWHGTQYGWANFTATVPVVGCVKITLGGSNYGNGEMIVTNAEGKEVAKIDHHIGAMWSASTPENVAVGYYRTNEPTTLNFSKADYLPYFAVEAIAEADLPAEVTTYNVTFEAGEGTGTAPKSKEVEVGAKVVVPANTTLFVEGKTLTAWTDGTNEYKAGDEITVNDNIILTPVFTENATSLSDRTAETTIVWQFGEANGVGTLNAEGKSTILVTQATIGETVIDVKMDIDATSGKLNNVGRGDKWAQCNDGTKLTIPAYNGTVVSFDSYSDGTGTTIGGVEAANKTATYDGTDATLDIVAKGMDYIASLTAVYPAPAVAESNYYVVGNMTGWGPKAEYKMTRNTAADTEEYMYDITLTTESQFKIAKSDDGTKINDSDWYPTGMDNNYGEHGEIAADGEYTIYFRPNADGNDDWFYKYIYVAAKEEPVAKDITATWDFANNCAKLAAKGSEGSSYTAETMASDVEGISMKIVYNGGAIKNNDNSYQVSTGVEMQIPVKNAGDLVTVKGYPGYSKYTIGNNTEELTGDNSYKAKGSDVEAGYISVTSKDGNNYYLSISVVQYAPKEKITIDNEPATATFPFNEGTEGQKATFSNADYFLTSKVTHGSNWTIQDKTTYAGTTETRLTPADRHDSNLTDDDVVRFLITPKPGFTFTPTKVSFKANRYGTDNGLIDAYWQNPDGTTVELEKEIKPERNNTDKNTEKSYDITGATPAEGACGLKLFLYNLQADKQIGLADIVIEGTLTGTEKDVPVLASFKLNGNEYDAEEVFGDGYEATLELPKAQEMVSANNPLTEVTAKSGEVGNITYDNKDNACTVTIPMTAGETTMDYVLNVVFKPDFTLSYLDVEGNVLTTQTVEKDAAIGEFAYDINDVPATKDGYKARGWFKTGVVGEKFTTADVITADTKLYAIQTPIEVSSTHDKYFFDLTNKFFYDEDHEAFVPSGEGYYWHDAQHGWAFKNGNKIDLLVGPKAVISVTICRYGSADNISITENGVEIGTLPGKNNTDTDGEIVAFNYEGTGGTITLNLNTTGEMYIHAIKIVNIAEVNYDSEGQWYFVKPGDAGSFLDVLDVVNGKNAAADAERAFIFLPNGTYDLDATVKTAISGKNISIIGESMDKTIIVTTPDKSLEGLGSADMFQASTQNLYLQDLTLQNALDYYKAGSAGRAAVLQDSGTRTIGKNIRMLSYQDTYYSSNASQQAYWENCDIHGTVDFICGGGDVRFQNTTISLEKREISTDPNKDGKGSRTITAPTTTTQFGYVFDGCKVVDLSEGKGDWNFGRTWQNEPICIYLNTTLDDNAKSTLISTRWIEKGMNNKDPKIFGEFNTMDAAGTNITPASNIIKSHGGEFQTILTAEQADAYAYDKMFTDWDPAALTAQAAAPTNAKINGNVITWDAVEGAKKYLVEYEGEFIALTTEPTYTIPTVEETSARAEMTEDNSTPAYTVRAANAQGGFGEKVIVAETQTGISEINAGNGTAAKAEMYNLAGQRVNHATKGIYIINGKKVVIK